MDFGILTGYGFNCADALRRCMNNKELYASLLDMFVAEELDMKVKRALAVGNPTAVFDALHELKGVSASVGIERLSAAARPFTDLFRNTGTMPDEKAYLPLLEVMLNEYKIAVSAIAEAKNG